MWCELRILNKYKTYTGSGHWFEEDDRYMRIGYSWDKPEKLKKGLQNILKAIILDDKTAGPLPGAVASKPH